MKKMLFPFFINLQKLKGKIVFLSVEVKLTRVDVKF